MQKCSDALLCTFKADSINPSIYHLRCYKTTCAPVCTSSSGCWRNHMMVINVRVCLSNPIRPHPPPLSRYLCPAENDSFISHDHFAVKLVVPSSSFREAVSWMVNYNTTPPQTPGNRTDINKYTEDKVFILMDLMTCLHAEWRLTCLLNVQVMKFKVFFNGRWDW